MQLPEIIKEIRKRTGDSQKSLAAALNVSFATINRWETGRCEPSPIAMDGVRAYCHRAGEEYILEDLLEETHVKPAGESYGNEELFWTGYIYRYWHYLTGENGREIYAQAKALRMKECYLGFHTLDAVMAVEDLKEIHRQEQALRR